MRRALGVLAVLAVAAAAIAAGIGNSSLMQAPHPDFTVDHHPFILPSVTATRTEAFCWKHDQDTIPMEVHARAFSLAGTITAATVMIQNSSINSLRKAIDLYAADDYGAGAGCTGLDCAGAYYRKTVPADFEGLNPVWRAGTTTCGTVTLTGSDTPTVGYLMVNLVTRDVTGLSGE